MMSQMALKLEQVSLTMIEGTIYKWHKNKGDQVKEGEVLYEVETDKIVAMIESPVTGQIGEILVLAGSRVPIGTELCVIEMSGQKMGADVAAVSMNAAPEATSQAVPDKVRISPLARAIARQHKIDFSQIKGSGIGGLIVKADILSRVEGAASTEALISKGKTLDGLEFETIPLSSVRKSIVSRLQASHREIPKVTTFIDVNMTKIVLFKKMVPVSYNAFILKVTAETLKDYPLLNAQLGNDEIHLLKQVNISVAIESDDGLMTAVIRDTNLKSLIDIDYSMKELAARARRKQLQLKDIQGGTFTVTNSGVFGSLMFTPLINYPQCAVLGVGKIAKEPMVVNDSIEIGYKMILCLSYDHRIVDGKYAVSFLAAVKDKLEQCDSMMLLTGADSKERAYYDGGA